MTTEERGSKLAQRCAEHPGRQAVAECEACHRSLCVACAVPVRGRVLGVECVASVLGEDPQPLVKPGRSRASIMSGAGLGGVVVASLLPWTRFGVGSSILGGWDAVPSWSLLASLTGVVGLIVWWLSGRRGRRGAEVAALVGGLVATAAALLAAIHPPPFTRPSIGPDVAFLAGITALVAGVIEARRPRHVG